MRLRHVLSITLLAAAGLAGCGGGNDGDRAATTPRTGPGLVPGVPRELQPPAGVPQVPTGSVVDPQDAKVIRRWARVLARGDEQAAADEFGLPMKFQNATPVLTVDTRRERLAIQQSLTCGAKVTKLEGADEYVIVSFELVGRPGGEPSCSGSARSAIRVENRKITRWYRVFELPSEALGDPV